MLARNAQSAVSRCNPESRCAWKGLVQSSFEGFAEANGIAFEQSAVMSLLLFMEAGGRWVLPIVATGLACLVIAPPRLRARR